MPTIKIFDGHNDAVQHVAEYRPGGRDFLQRSQAGHLDLPRARQGGMIGGLFALFAKPTVPPQDDFTRTTDGYEVRLAAPLDPAFARDQIERQLAALRQIVARSAGAIRCAASVGDIEAAMRDGVFSIVLHMEGADAIDPELTYLDRLFEYGLRSLGLVWSRPNLFGCGVPFAYPRSPDTGPGLTGQGKALVRACNERGIMIDLAHINERGFWDVAAITAAPLVVTHACAHVVCASTRNLTDRQLDAIRDSGGVVGFNLCVCDVRPDGHLDANTPLTTVLHHFNLMRQRLGEDHIAIGSDFDGAMMPHPVRDASHLPALLDGLRDLGYTDAALRKIACDNWLRVFRATWLDSARGRR